MNFFKGFFNAIANSLKGFELLFKKGLWPYLFYPILVWILMWLGSIWLFSNIATQLAEYFNQLLNFKINGCHNMYDLHKHLMGSLKSNCESFKIPKKYSKLDCDHNEIQILYNNDKDNCGRFQRRIEP